MEAQKHSKAAGAASDEVTQKFFQEVALLRMTFLIPETVK